MDGALQNLIFCVHCFVYVQISTPVELKSDVHIMYGLVKPWGYDAVGAASTQFQI
jgi:hypothetical protein